MYSRHTDPDTGVVTTLSVDSRVKRSVSVELPDGGGDFSLSDLRQLVAKCADTPAESLVSVRVIGEAASRWPTKIAVEHKQRTSGSGFPCQGGDDCVCHEGEMSAGRVPLPAGDIEQHRDRPPR
ncbi:hypothetical protein [Nocardia cyriacigeorgica]|uniref:hypothetical protein n=1 Tax=Nocardia cyriacigeorgica TaxID=135487 RepID=UPI0024545A85|nr:hypothetical protein [Nocardia cyriacigeorgica]